MKKFLLTAVLILAVLTSLTAGTLASYYQEQTIDGNVKPMYFQFTKTGVQGFNTTVKLAPGQSQIYAVDVKNLSEMAVAFSTLKSLTNNAFGRALSAEWCSDITGATPLEAAPTFNLSNGYSYRVFLKVTWADMASNADEIALAQDSDSLALLRVTITGTSV